MKKMKKNNKIGIHLFRSAGNFSVEDENSRIISGRAIVFDSWSRNLGGFIEKINREAISEDLIVNSDIIMNVDHDNSRMLARYNKGEGTLSLDLREDGLYFSFEAPGTAYGDEILWHVRHKNLFECSFACTLYESDIEEGVLDGQKTHEITQIRGLYDVSIVCHAAYPATMVRKLEDQYSLEDEEEEEIIEDIEPKDEQKEDEERNEEEVNVEEKSEDPEEEKEEEKSDEDEENEEKRSKEIINRLEKLREDFLKNINI